MNPERMARFRALILDRLSGLADAGDRGRDSARPVELDQSRVGRLSRQDALQSQALSAAALERNSAQIVRLRRALGRVEDGDYGWCEDCGEAIDPARLEVDPAAERCIACARRRERD